MASSGAQSSVSIFGAYQALLAPLNTLEYFDAQITPDQIESTLRSKSSEEITTILSNRMRMLQIMVEFFDTKVSLCSFNKDAVVSFQEHFVNRIFRVIDIILDPDPIIDEQDTTVRSSLVQARSALAVAIDELEDIDALDQLKQPESNKQIIKHKGLLYAKLRECTEFFEKGLKGLQISAIPIANNETGNIEKKMDEMSKQLNEHREAIKLIYERIHYRTDREPFGLERINDYEKKMRNEFLASLLKIPEQQLPDDEESRKLIAQSGFGNYINYKSEIIKYLREAKIALNLMQDWYELSPTRMRRSDLDGHLNDCAASLGKAVQHLK